MITKILLIVYMSGSMENGLTIQTFGTMNECQAVKEIIQKDFKLAEEKYTWSHDVAYCQEYSFSK